MQFSQILPRDRAISRRMWEVSSSPFCYDIIFTCTFLFTGGALVRSLVSSDAGPIDLSVTGSGFQYSITPTGGKFAINGDSKLVVMSSLDREVG